jgi:hypothetical protein
LIGKTRRSDLVCAIDKTSEPWSIAALVRAGFPLHDRRRWNAVQYFLGLKSSSGGWSESPFSRPTVWATYNALELFQCMTLRFDPQETLSNFFEATVRSVTEINARRTELDFEMVNYQRQIDELHEQVRALEKDKLQVIHSMSNFLEVGVGPLKVFLSIPLFWILSALCILAFVLALRFAQGAAREYKIATFFIIPGASYLLWHVVSDQVFQWKKDATAGVGRGIVGIVMAIHFGIRGTSIELRFPRKLITREQ